MANLDNSNQNDDTQTPQKRENAPCSVVLFTNTNGRGANSPTHVGRIYDSDGVCYQLGMWEKTDAKGKKYFTGSFRPWREPSASDSSSDGSDGEF